MTSASASGLSEDTKCPLPRHALRRLEASLLLFRNQMTHWVALRLWTVTGRKRVPGLGKIGGQAMRTALLTATALVALSSISVAKDRLTATTEAAPKPINPAAILDSTTPKVRANDWKAPDSGRLHWMIDKPCRGSERAYSEGACDPGPPPYRPRP